MIDTLKTCGVNGAVLGATTLESMETGLSILLLIITITWTVVKLTRLLKDKNERKTKVPKTVDGYWRFAGGHGN